MAGFGARLNPAMARGLPGSQIDPGFNFDPSQFADPMRPQAPQAPQPGGPLTWSGQDQNAVRAARQARQAERGAAMARQPAPGQAPQFQPMTLQGMMGGQVGQLQPYEPPGYAAPGAGDQFGGQRPEDYLAQGGQAPPPQMQQLQGVATGGGGMFGGDPNAAAAKMTAPKPQATMTAMPMQPAPPQPVSRPMAPARQPQVRSMTGGGFQAPGRMTSAAPPAAAPPKARLSLTGNKKKTPKPMAGSGY